ncbi:alpha-L-rhamnosidase C-terminal domain-containing protein [Nibricoccus aquaticus]|nr:alpha-L-rhamnosidase C-terminal domain-containing protein [Nibricoccus aquaticus]
MPQPFVNRSAWIWSLEGSHAAAAEASPSHYQVRLFRRSFELGDAAATLTAHISADSRYLFYCNGVLVSRGPAKGDIHHHFYDTCELTRWLKPGRNMLAAVVLDMSRVAHRPSALGAPCSVMTYTGGFLLEGELGGASEKTGRLDTGLPGWLVKVDTSFRFQNDGTRFEGYHGYFEHRVSRELPAGWNQPEFDDSGWKDAATLYLAERHENRRDPTSPYGLVPRMISPLEEGAPARFSSVFLQGGADAGDGWLNLITQDKSVIISPGETCSVIVDTGELTTAYPLLDVSGGAGARIRFTYAEALRLPWATKDAKLLGRPQSLENLASHFADESSGWTFDRRGKISGWSDVWEPAGSGAEQFEPWHWRAFRYVGLEITAGTEPLTLLQLKQRFTAYPYKITGAFECSDPRLNKIWDVALRTMRLCSHETFEDCPHYEQMQYAGDTMITSKIAMLTSGDASLGRQALYQFDWSRLPEGLTQSRFPSRLLQVIPSWSLHWVTNVRDYVYCTGDLVTLRDLLPGIRAVLDWFRRHADESGLPSRLPFWNITDWCSWWPRGVVPGAADGPVCIISAQYIQALDEVSDLCRIAGRSPESTDLVKEADGLRRALHTRFWSEKEGLYFDRPGGPEVSQYGNAWAVICGAAGEKERAQLLKRFPTDPLLAPGSFFCWHAVFRALRVCGVYDRFPEFLGPWHEMVDYGLDTFVEENSYWRSLCHAWSAHPALEFIGGVLGVTPKKIGFTEVDVAPNICGLTHASGRVCTPAGAIDVSWEIRDGVFGILISAPAKTFVNVTLPGGHRRCFEGGRFEEKVKLL